MGDGPVDFWGGLEAFDPNAAFIKGLMTPGAVQAGLAQQQAQRAEASAKITQLARALEQQKQVDEARQSFFGDPSTANLERLTLLDPESFKSLKAVHDMKDADAQRQDLRDFTHWQGLLQANDFEGAGAAVQRRIDADKKAGLATADDEQVLDLIKAKNPEALGMVKGYLYAALGKDHYTQAFEADSKAAIANAKLPGEIAHTAAQTAQANAQAAKDGYVTLKADEAIVPVASIGQPPAPGAAPAQAGPGPVVTGPVGQAIDSVVEKVGAAPAEASYLRTTSMIESRGGKVADRKGNSSTGPFQFHPDTFARLGGTDITDPQQQAAAALQLARQDAAVLGNTLKRAPTSAEVYLAHQQGIAGAKALLTAGPDVKAVDAIAPLYKTRALAMQAIVNNGGKPNMTAADFAQHWRDEYAKAEGTGGDTAAAPAGNGLPPGSIAGPNFNGGGDGEAALSPESVAMVGQEYLAHGASALVNMGQGKTGVANKAKVMNWAAQAAKDAGTTNPELVLRHVQNKANVSALGQTQKMLSAVTASESTLSKNMDLALTLAKRGGLGPTGQPWLNTPINKLRIGTGSETAKAFDNARITVANEYAKILSSTTGTGGVTSDSARTEAQNLFPAGMTLGQFVAAIGVAKTEAANRHSSLAGEVGRLGASIAGTAPKPDEPAGPAAPVGISAAEAAKLPKGTKFTGTDGKEYVRK